MPATDTSVTPANRRQSVLATPLAPYDGTDDEVVQRTWGADAIFCRRCFPGMWHHRDYHRERQETRRGD